MYKILNDTNLNDPDFVKDYLEHSFSKRKSKKSYKLYINICKIYDLYPKSITDILDNINTLGYYKDYFYIYMFSRNDNLSNYIMNLVIKQINSDLDNLKKKQDISTLGKWLPRENSKINKKSKFIDNFSNIMFPHSIDIFNKRKKYRLLKTKLNTVLGTLESKMATKNFSDIDYDKVSPNALAKNIHNLQNHPECLDSLAKFQYDQLKSLSLEKFVTELGLKTFSSEGIYKVWEDNKFILEVPYINNFIQKSVCILDLSKDTFKLNKNNFACGIGLLTNKHSTADKKVIINNNFIDLSELDIFNQAGTISSNVGPIKSIDMEKYYDKLQTIQNCDSVIVVSGKTVSNIEFITNKGYKFLQYKLVDNGFDVVYSVGDKIRTFKKQVKQDLTNFVVINNIKKITNNSTDFKQIQFPLIMISFWALLFFGLKLFEFFYL